MGGGEMGAILSVVYPWVKALHIMAVMSWMAGLFYLPRLFVYHVEEGAGRDAVFAKMEDKLYRIIMTPAMVASWGFGLLLVATPGVVDWGALWPWSKAAGVLMMSAFHLWLGARRRDFAAGRNRLSGRQYRLMNEVPTLLMVVIVLSVVVRF
ncbi:MAG: protoporphyrinogen oxidase HemJ [Roseovarius sp.]